MARILITGSAHGLNRDPQRGQASARVLRWMPETRAKVRDTPTDWARTRSACRPTNR